MDTHPPQPTVVSSSTGQPNVVTEGELVDPLPKKMQSTVNARLKHDLLVCCVLAVIYLGLHCSTVFTVLQPDLNTVLHRIAGILGLLLHYLVPQMRKHWPWLCMSLPILRQREFGQFEPRGAAEVMWFEQLVVYLCMLERNVLYPIVFLSALTSDSMRIVGKFGIGLGTILVVMCGLKCEF
uniref:Pecanex-like protein n=1 Tax=Phlebotomus papatasi TaxID=29031 RepID=A0A1B0D9I2_PHLPP